MDIYDVIKDLPLRTIVEAGGHYGEDTRKLCKMFPAAQVVTCEPIPTLYKQILELKDKFSNLEVYNVALSDKDGATILFVDDSADGLMGASSLLPITDFYKTYVEAEKPINVACCKLSTLAEQAGLQSIDLLWLDIEMMEYRVLKASESLLENINHIYLEISYERFRKGQWKEEDMNALLFARGFTQVWIESQGHPVVGMWQANALYSRL